MRALSALLLQQRQTEEPQGRLSGDNGEIKKELTSENLTQKSREGHWIKICALAKKIMNKKEDELAEQGRRKLIKLMRAKPDFGPRQMVYCRFPDPCSCLALLTRHETPEPTLSLFLLCV
ncbi:hypothetical protein ILUMI_05765 [Ignelater luminosus]|uniref:Uncharacterized protein n=1 Tax=Ignelater luminosus TaxID=2038154 RepID=A0A8K0GID8_IGNLU|nr:hypothetical protein ILUMI_05765 [Ignelater luminosus]